MKKILKFTFLFFLIISCAKEEDNSEVENLTNQISALNDQISSLQSQISSLTSNNSSLSSQLSSAQSELESAQADLASANVNIEDLTQRLELVSKELNSVEYTSVNKIDATGTVSNQTVAEAKQTIFGRWNITPFSSSKEGLSGKASIYFNANKKNCLFNFIEFTDENYLMAITTGDGSVDSVFGEYIFEEDSEGKVTSVDLMFDLGDSNTRVARLTNIVVTENGGSINATFDVDMTLPPDLVSCNTLSGSYSAPKEDPVPETETASALSNHGKLIGEWNMVSFSSIGSDGTQETIEYILEGFCIVEEEDPSTGEFSEYVDPNCEKPSQIIVNFSTFGTYSVAFILSNGTPAEVAIDNWQWLNEDQTILDLNFGDSLTIETLTETSLVLTTSYEDEGVSFNETATFERN